MLPGSSPDYNTTIDIAYGKAILAGGGLMENSYRRDFDVSIPVYNSLTRQAHVKPSSETKRCNGFVNTYFMYHEFNTIDG